MQRIIFNYLSKDTLPTVAFITSKIIKQEENYFEVHADIRNGLRIDSIIKLNKLATIDKELVLGELGKLSDSDLKTIDNKLISVFSIGL